MINNLCESIGRAATNALLKEVAASPKPGLVDRLNSGAHRDMDFYTFLNSTTAISPFMKVFSEIGYSLASIDENSLLAIRPTGIECEKAMFKATQGINTHKGAVFSLGILTTAAAFSHKTYNKFDSKTICEYAAILSAPAMKDFEKCKDSPHPTKGEILYLKHGITGIRGEAAKGYPTVINYALPVLKECLEKNYDINTSLVNTLLSIMSYTEDTNILGRCSFEELDLCKKLSEQALALGGLSTDVGREFVMNMNDIFCKKNISPGGSADLLILTIFLNELNEL